MCEEWNFVAEFFLAPEGPKRANQRSLIFLFGEDRRVELPFRWFLWCGISFWSSEEVKIPVARVLQGGFSF